MAEDFNLKRDKTFRSIYNLYFMLYFFVGILPVNIDNLLINLPGTTKFGIGIVIASSLVIGIVSILTFGYLGEKISEKFTRKKLFSITNLCWILAYGSLSFSLNYNFYLIFYIFAAIGTGAFLPLGFAIIGDLYSPKERGSKFGVMQFGLLLGNGLGIILGGLLGSYTGPNGWRYAYVLGFILGILSLINFIRKGVEPERGRSEPEFADFKGEIDYNYKITFHNLIRLFKVKSIIAILISVLASGIASSTLGNWAIYYLTLKIGSSDGGFYATTIYLLAGMGALPGTIVGGRLGDSLFRADKPKGRVLVSLLGLLLGISFMFSFYLVPFFTTTISQVIFSWIIFILLGLIAYFFTSFSIGNQFAIYSELCVPELRSTTNALNGLMINIGGIIGNLLLSSLIERNLSWLPFAIFLVLLIWLLGSLLWVIPYFYYTKDSQICRELMAERRKEMDQKKVDLSNS